MKALSPIYKYFWKYKTRLILGILFILLSNYFRILSPQITGYVVNNVVKTIAQVNNPGKSIQTKNAETSIVLSNDLYDFNSFSFEQKILFSGILLLGLALLSGLFMFFMRQTIIVMSRHIEFDQKNEIYQHYQSLDIGFYKSNATGDLMNRISEDVSRVRMFTGPALMYFFNLAIVIGLSIFFMLQSDVKLTLVALSPLPILAITIYTVN
jgi:ATP-binding cassette subfamily B protein